MKITYPKITDPAATPAGPMPDFNMLPFDRAGMPRAYSHAATPVHGRVEVEGAYGRSPDSDVGQPERVRRGRAELAVDEVVVHPRADLAQDPRRLANTDQIRCW